MKYKRLILICLLICLFTVTSAVAADVNETLVSNEDQTTVDNDKMLAVEERDIDELNAEKNSEFSEPNEEILGSGDYNFIENHDIVVNKSDTIVYQVRLVDNANNPYYNNQVIFTFNDENHVVKTDCEGYASYIIDTLSPGVYPIKASLGDVYVTNKITVKNFLSPYKFYECSCEAYFENDIINIDIMCDDGVYNGYLKFYMSREYEEDGEYYFEEYEYIRYVTSSSIQLAVPEGIGKGIYQYTINCPIDGGDEGTFTGSIAVGVERNKTIISFENTENSEWDEFIYINLLDDDEDNDYIQVSLKDESLKVIKGVKVILKINDKTYAAKTNAKGVARFNLDLLPRAYIATAIYNGNLYYDRAVATMKVICNSSDSQEEEPEFTPTVSLETSINNDKDIIAIECSENLKGNIVVWVNGQKRYNEPIDYDSIYGNHVYLDLKDLKITEPNSYGIIIKYVDLDDNEFDIKSYALNVMAETVEEKTTTQIEFLDTVYDSQTDGQVIHITYNDGNAVFYGKLKDGSGKGIINKQISIKINGHDSNVMTDANGIFAVPCNTLIIGENVVFANFKGDETYKESKISIPVIVESAPVTLDDFKIDVVTVTINDSFDAIISVECKYGITGSFIVYVNGSEQIVKDIDYYYFQANKLYLTLQDLEITECGEYAIEIDHVDQNGDMVELTSYILSVNWLNLCDGGIDVNLPENINGSIQIFVDNVPLDTINLDDYPDGIEYISLDDKLEFGTYDITLYYEGNYPSLRLNKIINITYDLGAYQPTINGYYDSITSDYVELHAYLPENVTGKVTIFLNGKTYYINDPKDNIVRISNEDLILGESVGIISLTGDKKYPDKNETFIFRIYPDLNKPTISLVDVNDNLVVKLKKGMSGVCNLYDMGELDLDSYKLMLSAPINDGYCSIPISSLHLGHNHMVIEINSEGRYFSHVNYLLRVIENNPNITVSLDSDNIEAGDDAVIRISHHDVYVDEVSFILDGYYLKSLGMVNRNALTEKISDLTVGKHEIRIQMDEEYIKTFYITVNEKSSKPLTPTNVPAPVKEPVKVDKITLTLKKVTVKKSAKKLVLQATLKKGKTPLKKIKITFKFNGKKYFVKTNKKGVAKVTINKKVLKKLKVGKKVKIQASYGKLTKKISIKVKK